MQAGYLVRSGSVWLRRAEAAPTASGAPVHRDQCGHGQVSELATPRPRGLSLIAELLLYLAGICRDTSPATSVASRRFTGDPIKLELLVRRY